MTEVLKMILDTVDKSKNKTGYLDVLFGINKKAIINGKPVILFGAGSMAKDMMRHLNNFNIKIECFCDNSISSTEVKQFCGKQVFSFSEMVNKYKNRTIIIATLAHHQSITKQLLTHGFQLEQIFFTEKKPDFYWLHAYYSMLGPVSKQIEHTQQFGNLSVTDLLRRDADKLEKVYNLYTDQRSKDLFIAKLALHVSDASFDLFRDFMLLFSEAIQKFGFNGYNGTPEDYFYFNNEIITLENNEIYIDVGAFDGDTVETFVNACKKNNITYKNIHAFEPDPNNFKALQTNTKKYHNITLHQMGLWSESKMLKFKSTNLTLSPEGSMVCDDGDIEIKAMPLDDILANEKVTLLKMDPPGDVVLELIKGAQNTIAIHKPKLAIAAYHSVAAIYEVPLLIQKICPDYSFYYRHNTYHLADTDIYAIAGNQ